MKRGNLLLVVFLLTKAINCYSIEHNNYVIDAKKGKMYVYPPAEKISSLGISLLEGPLLAIENCKDVVVQGITFQYGRHIGIYMENTRHALIKDCVIRNMGRIDKYARNANSIRQEMEYMKGCLDVP